MARKRYYVKIVLAGEIRETPAPFSWIGRKRRGSLHELLRTLDALARNPRVDCLLLAIRSLSIGWAQVEELRRAVRKVREAGKSCIACVESPNHPTIYLAAAAEEVYLTPAATFELVGLRAESFFFKELFDEYGVQAELVPIGEFKTAGEMFTRSGISEAGRDMMAAILGDIQDRLVAALVENGGLTKASVRKAIEDGPLTAQEAAERGLVQGLAYESEIEDRLESGAPEKLARLPESKLLKTEGFLRRRLHPRRPEIAYLVAEGMIVQGSGGRGRGRWSALDAQSLLEHIRAVRRRRNVRAVVLRVRSPGGSGLASDLIWHELRKLNREKPVILSFGDVAASGGYYLATAGRKIFADPSTLTGSIGVIGGKFSGAGLLDRLKIRADAVELGPHAGHASVTRPFNEDETDNLRRHLTDFYERLFLPKVAENRKTDVESIRKVAGGRVWTGAQALEVGLVDALGGILEAIEEARRAGGLTRGKYRIVTAGGRRSIRDLARLVLPGTSARERLLALSPDLEIV